MNEAVLVLAGSDPSGHAGLQADVRHLARHELLACALPTCLTRQTAGSFAGLEAVDADLLAEAILALPATAATKIGALHDARIVQAVARALSKRTDPVVLDPVLRSSSGGVLLDDAGVEAMLEVLVPRTRLITPNVPELGVLVPEAVTTEAAARALLLRGAYAVLVKGGHAAPRTDGRIADVLFTRDGRQEFLGDPLPLPAPRGTGCGLATLIAARLARGVSLAPAVTGARAELRERWRQAHAAGRRWL